MQEQQDNIWSKELIENKRKILTRFKLHVTITRVSLEFQLRVSTLGIKYLQDISSPIIISIL